MMRKIVGGLALALLSLPVWAQVPAGWQIVQSPKPLTSAGATPGKGGQCQMAVPADWVPNTALNGFGQTHFGTPADRKAKGTTSLYESAPGRSFEDAKRGVVRYNAPMKVFEDSSKRFWYQSKESNSLFTVWEVIVAADPVCILGISFNSPSLEDTARAIALSLAPAAR
jgi:hypothetical protein